jgi:hypothetical protein
MNCSVFDWHDCSFLSVKLSIVFERFTTRAFTPTATTHAQSPAYMKSEVPIEAKLRQVLALGPIEFARTP